MYKSFLPTVLKRVVELIKEQFSNDHSLKCHQHDCVALPLGKVLCDNFLFVNCPKLTVSTPVLRVRRIKMMLTKND